MRSLLTTTRERPCAVTKTQPKINKIKVNIKKPIRTEEEEEEALYSKSYTWIWCSAYTGPQTPVHILLHWGSAALASQMALVVKNLSANAVDIRNEGSIPGSGRSPGGGNGNPLQYSCLENPRDRGTWWARVPAVVQSRTWLRIYAHTHSIPCPD